MYTDLYDNINQILEEGGGYFFPGSINLVRTYISFECEYGHVFRKKYNSIGTSLVKTAEVSITESRLDKKPVFDLFSVMLDIFDDQIFNLSWRDRIWSIPTFKKYLFFDGQDREKNRLKNHRISPGWEKDIISLMAHSLLLTVVDYRLKSRNARRKRYHKDESVIWKNSIFYISFGFDLLIDWVERGVEVDPKENKLIKLYVPLKISDGDLV